MAALNKLRLIHLALRELAESEMLFPTLSDMLGESYGVLNAINHGKMKRGTAF